MERLFSSLFADSADPERDRSGVEAETERQPAADPPTTTKGENAGSKRRQKKLPLFASKNHSDRRGPDDGKFTVSSTLPLSVSPATLGPDPASPPLPLRLGVGPNAHQQQADLQVLVDSGLNDSETKRARQPVSLDNHHGSVDLSDGGSRPNSVTEENEMGDRFARDLPPSPEGRVDSASAAEGEREAEVLADGGSPGAKNLLWGVPLRGKLAIERWGLLSPVTDHVCETKHSCNLAAAKVEADDGSGTDRTDVIVGTCVCECVCDPRMPSPLDTDDVYEAAKRLLHAMYRIGHSRLRKNLATSPPAEDTEPADTEPAKPRDAEEVAESAGLRTPREVDEKEPDKLNNAANEWLQATLSAEDYSLLMALRRQYEEGSLSTKIEAIADALNEIAEVVTSFKRVEELIDRTFAEESTDGVCSPPSLPPEDLVQETLSVPGNQLALIRLTIHLLEVFPAFIDELQTGSCVGERPAGTRAEAERTQQQRKAAQLGKQTIRARLKELADRVQARELELCEREAGLQAMAGEAARVEEAAKERQLALERDTVVLREQIGKVERELRELKERETQLESLSVVEEIEREKRLRKRSERERRGRRELAKARARQREDAASAEDLEAFLNVLNKALEDEGPDEDIDPDEDDVPDEDANEEPIEGEGSVEDKGDEAQEGGEGPEPQTEEKGKRGRGGGDEAQPVGLRRKNTERARCARACATLLSKISLPHIQRRLSTKHLDFNRRLTAHIRECGNELASSLTTLRESVAKVDLESLLVAVAEDMDSPDALSNLDSNREQHEEQEEVAKTTDGEDGSEVCATTILFHSLSELHIKTLEARTFADALVEVAKDRPVETNAADQINGSDEVDEGREVKAADESDQKPGPDIDEPLQAGEVEEANVDGEKAKRSANESLPTENASSPLIVLPDSVAQISETLRLCRQHLQTLSASIKEVSKDCRRCISARQREGRLLESMVDDNGSALENLAAEKDNAMKAKDYRQVARVAQKQKCAKILQEQLCKRRDDLNGSVEFFNAMLDDVRAFEETIGSCREKGVESLSKILDDSIRDCCKDLLRNSQKTVASIADKVLREAGGETLPRGLALMRPILASIGCEDGPIGCEEGSKG